MVERKKPTARQQAEHAYKQAERAIGKGDRANADRWLKTAEKMAAVAERLAAEKASNPFPENVEEIRAEMRARIGRAVTVAREVEEWEYRRDVREAVALYARKHGLPEPPDVEPCPHPENAFGMTLEDGYWPAPREEPVLSPRVRRRLDLPAEAPFDPYAATQDADADAR